MLEKSPSIMQSRGMGRNLKDDIEKIYAKLIALETEVVNLRQGYVVVNTRYAEALGSLKHLTHTSLEAAKRAAAAVAHQAEESLLQASAQAAAAAKRAAEAAAEAVKMSNLASESARTARQAQSKK